VRSPLPKARGVCSERATGNFFNLELVTVPHVSRRDRYDALPAEEQRRGRRPGPPKFHPPVPVEPTGAVVKWYRADLGFGFVKLAGSGQDCFLHKQVAGDGDLPAGSTLTVRPGIDPVSGKPAVMEIVAVDRSTALPASPPPVVPKRIETGRLISRTVSGSGFLVPDLGGENIYVPASRLVGLEVKVGDRLECKVGDGHRGPVATKVVKVLA
jgi:cold shock CspA family protein